MLAVVSRAESTGGWSSPALSALAVLTGKPELFETTKDPA